MDLFMSKKTVLVIGEHQQMRGRLGALAQDMGLEVIGLIQPAYALQIACCSQPDVVLIDVEGTRMGAQGMSAAIHECLPHGRVLMLMPQILCLHAQAQAPERVAVMARTASDDAMMEAVRGLLGSFPGGDVGVQVASNDTHTDLSRAQWLDPARVVRRRQRIFAAPRRPGFQGSRVAVGRIGHRHWQGEGEHRVEHWRGVVHANTDAISSLQRLQRLA
jgi:DNA-binding NarL/FixJ family response regulator